jgi:phage gpG-like protein
MTSSIRAEIKGLRDTQRNMEQAVKDLHGGPMLNAMRDATLMVTRDAKKNAPVDTGRLRASITPEVIDVGETIRGVVGSNVSYAPYVELGTRPHWPPIAALEVWARRHGVSAFLVARAISRRGTKPVEYLQRAFDANKGRIELKINQAVTGIIKSAND